MVPRKYQPLLFFAAMLLVFDLAYSLLSTCQPPIYQSAAEQGGHQNHCTPFGGILFSFGILPLAHFLHTYEHELVAGFTIVLAFSTVALWLSTNKLWEATRDTATKQEQDTRILQRAYISVEPGGIAKSDSNKECHPNIVVRNAGNLPAGKVRWVIYRETEKNRLRTNLPIDELQVDGLITLTPGAIMTQGGDTIEVGDGPLNIRREAGLYLYVWGSVLYDDGFGDPRRTRFCHRYNLINLRDDGEPVTVPGGKYTGFWLKGRSIDAEYGRYHRHGNDAD